MEQHSKEAKGTIQVTVRDGAGRHTPIQGALVLVSAVKSEARGKSQTGSELVLKSKTETDHNGQAKFELEPRSYSIAVESFVAVKSKRVDLEECGCACVDFAIPVGFDFQIVPCRDEAPQAACPDLIPEGTQIWMRGVLN